LLSAYQGCERESLISTIYRAFPRSGKASDFQKLARSFVTILDATPKDRDDLVIEEIDKLAKQQVVTRGAFFSEMLCLRFPEEYPLVGRPVEKYLKMIEFRARPNATEGEQYIDLARALRSSLLDDPGYPAKNLAELDAVIRLAT